MIVCQLERQVISKKEAETGFGEHTPGPSPKA